MTSEIRPLGVAPRSEPIKAAYAQCVRSVLIATPTFPAISPLKMEKLLLLIAVVDIASAAVGTFSYTDQGAWGGSCQSGTRQSPIDITSAAVKDNDDLITLDLVDWDKNRTGTFRNTGSSVKFEQYDSESSASTINHRGTYVLKQFHLHWGDADNNGSEHLVDGKATSAEIHFVHLKRNEPADSTAGDAYAVVGVRAVVDKDENTSVWRELNVGRVQGFEDYINATVRFIDLLPVNRSYFYYEGSLTTPNCSEVVQWFLLQNTISIPQAYLEQLRTIKNKAGESLTFNFRETQALNDRTVSQYPPTSSGLAVKPVQLLTALSLIAVMIFCRV